MDKYLKDVLSRLEAMYGVMSNATGDTYYINDGVYPRYRYKKQTESLICYLKGAKTISTLNACLVLLQHGHTQEIGALCRMVDDFCNEIFFLLKPQGSEEKFSEDQLRFIRNFFQEEFDKPSNPLASTQKRNTVKVEKIHATFAKLANGEPNPSDAQEMLRTTHQAFSGYVHGSYPHIMEMFGGNPPRFHLSGMLSTPSVDEWRTQLVNYVYRLIMASVFVAKKLGIKDMEQPVMELIREFEEKTGIPKGRPSERLAAYKRKNVT